MQAQPPMSITTISLSCQFCQRIFSVRKTEFKRNNTKYCSAKCSSSARKGISNLTPNVECSFCGAEFHRCFSKQQNKSGLLFCSRDCKDRAQQIGSGFAKIQPGHYGKSGRNYRTIAFRNLLQKCSRCLYDEHREILVVHHRDRNRSNNALENLEILCPNCHAIEHVGISQTEKEMKLC